MQNKDKKAIDALEEAHRIALSPFVFQAAVSLKKLRIFDLIFKERHKGGISIEGISNILNLPVYGIGVLLEIAQSANLVEQDKEKNFKLTTTAYFLINNETVEKNMNFTNDVCYKGLFHLPKAITTGKPEGLIEFGDWSTIYQALSSLQPEVQKSWFEFDHHYSDEIFDEGLKYVFEKSPKLIFDIGTNTGKFSLKCLEYDKEVRMHLFDLPGQLKMARANIEQSGYGDRIQAFEIDWLSDNTQLPKGPDLIWMSQFLDCFSKEEIIKILRSCAEAMDKGAQLLITETFTDRQKYKNAKFVLEATSLYFTALANGNSKMYTSMEFQSMIEKAGLKINRDIEIGDYHTLLICSL